MSIVVIDSGGANLASLQYALERLGANVTVSLDPTVIQQADRVLLPGVGAAGAAMQRLRSAGLVPVLRDLRKPLLGICLGMQLLFEHSAEDDTETLGSQGCNRPIAAISCTATLHRVISPMSSPRAITDNRLLRWCGETISPVCSSIQSDPGRSALLFCVTF